MVTEVKYAATTNTQTAGSLLTLQGNTLVDGDVVLLTGQADGTKNGVWVVHIGSAWTRHTDHDTSAEFVRPWRIWVRSGSYANFTFHFTGPDSPTLDSSVLNFDIAERAEAVTSGLGLGLDELNNVIGMNAQGDTDGTYYMGALSFNVTEAGVFTWITGGVGMETYIEGFIPQYTAGGGSPVFTAGEAWVPGLSQVLEIPTDGNGPVNILPTSDLMYFYLQPSISGNNIRGIATAPAAAYLGTARNMTGDANTRYICALRTNGAATPVFYNFACQMLSDKRLLMTYLEDTTAAPFIVVNGSAAQTNTTVNLGPSGSKLVPPTSKMAHLRVRNNGTVQAWFGNSEDSANPQGGSGVTAVKAGSEFDFLMPLDANQSFEFSYNAAGGNLFVYCLGYVDRR